MRMIHPNHVLFDDGSLIQIGSNEMRRGAHELDPPLIGAVVGAGPFESGQEGMMNIDGSAFEFGAQLGTEDLHISSEDDKIDRVLINELEYLSFLFGLGLGGDG